MYFDSTQFLLTDYLIFIYLIITGILIFLFRKNEAIWYLHLLGRLIGVSVIVFIASEHDNPIIHFIHDWYPLITILIFYWELGLLAKLIFQEPLDQQVIDWEKKLFKCQPSLLFCEQFNYYYLSELLHFSYLAYYPMVIILPLQFYITNHMTAFYFTVFAETCVFYTCLIFYIFFPVAGPRYLFEKNHSLISQGPIFKWTHKLLAEHSSKGTAFPSSHVAMATIVFLCAIYFKTSIAWVLFPFWLGITVGVVYCRFHYALDAIFGVLVAVVVFSGILSQLLFSTIVP